MKSITINGSKRESVGKKATKALRNAGQVPCVLYGGDAKPLHFATEEISFNNLVYTPDVHTVEIKFEDGEKFDAILQDIQFHPVTDAILHVDFYQISDDKPITMEIPIHTEGVARGVKNGGVLRYNLRRLKVRGLAQELPDYITANVSKLKIGQKLYVTAVADESYEIQHPDNTVICQVRTSRNIVALEDDEDDEDEVPADEVPSTETDDVAAVKEGEDN
ncbi:50S ribosomal protein L25/general stress protein Ctc [Salegentibacter mishustinae]|jgi:large subunit ribosomal protein L25|uniref:50S ribosomal protein L25/general stress protein Ctc n=1 Tax=Salegentibacter mishustinae TaxID=270918 RepID=UPI00249205FF|nr:50S ribosomal protein L25/general stress protein Ctc [Salegentibacter mishustinae]MDX1426439.1 50S ribosomal protein L25/general stress protein Ctc [Salegentibacter mishustinae]MDX1719207.1 50S ribosomal protein L25/general stress protein Ctc [Salegentibacter mishustinae]|tara:strand:+ start:341 stop:1000 length:660 start_codon:yes stop_codon:yes gene_type:complete